MRTARLLIVVLPLALASTAPAFAQRARPPALITIHGRVVSTETRERIPYARIELEGSSSVVRSDIDGAFAFTAPPTGTLRFRKSGYVTVERKLPLPTDDVEISLVRTVAIAGRILNDFGEPIVGVTVTVTAHGKGSNGSFTAKTDDRGDYRIGGLPPGEYLASVVTLGGEFVAPPAQAVAPPGVSPMLAYRSVEYRTYFSDTTDPAAATALALVPGNERQDIDFHVPAARALSQPGTALLPLLLDARRASGEGATLRGTISDPAGRALPFAQVTIQGNASSSPDQPPSPLGVYRTTVADERGHYEFADLKAGSYRVDATKAGYSTSSLAGLMAVPHLFVLNTGDVREDDITLTPWGAISGHIRDDYGDPVQGVRVALLHPRYERGKRRLVETPGAAAITNDRGEFRLFAVPPGEYVARASIEVNPAIDLGGYAATFYPGTTAGSDARLLPIDAGTDLSGVDTSLLAMSVARVTGQAFDATGKATAQLRLSLVSAFDMSAPLTASVESDGRFAFENVLPGEYVLKADSGRTNTFTEGEFTAIPVSVGASGVTGLRVQASRGSTITGRFVFERVTKTTDPPPSAITIAAVPSDYDLAPTSFASTQANADGVFQLRGVTGERRLQVTRVPPGYMVRSILSGGRDITDEPVAFGRTRDRFDDVEVVLTDRVTELTGRVSNGRVPAAGAHVLIFSTDRGRWYPTSRHMRKLVTNQDGTFTAQGLPVGLYFAVATPAVPLGDDAWQDPVYLESLRTAATVVSVNDGQSERIALSVVRP